MSPPSKQRLLVSLLLVLLAVGCHARQSAQPEPVLPSDDAIARLLAMKTYQQYSSLPANTRIPMLFSDIREAELSLTTSQWKRYYASNDSFVDIPLGAGYVPPIQLPDIAARKTLHRGGWVNIVDTEQADGLHKKLQWVRCQSNSTTPNTLDIASDAGRAISQIQEQIKDAFNGYILSTLFMFTPTKSIHVFEYKELHCIHIDEGLSSQLKSSDFVSVHAQLRDFFAAFLVDIKLLHWYLPTGQTLRFGRFDPRRWNPNPVDGVRRNAASSPLLFVPPIGAKAAREHGWEVIQQTAKAAVEHFQRRVLANSGTGRRIGWFTSMFILKICTLISEIKLPTTMTFNELAERIAELAKYPRDTWKEWTALDASLDTLKMMHLLPVLQTASQLYEWVVDHANPESTAQKTRFSRLRKLGQKMVDKVLQQRIIQRLYQWVSRFIHRNPATQQTGIQPPPKISKDIALRVLNANFFFTVARMDRVVPSVEIEHLRWLTSDASPKSLKVQQSTLEQEQAKHPDNMEIRQKLVSILKSQELQKRFKMRSNPRRYG